MERSRLSAGMEYAGTVTLGVLASSSMKNQSLLFGSHASVSCSSIPEGRSQKSGTETRGRCEAGSGQRLGEARAGKSPRHREGTWRGACAEDLHKRGVSCRDSLVFSGSHEGPMSRTAVGRGVMRSPTETRRWSWTLD